MQPQDLRRLVRKWTLPVLALIVLGAAVAYGVSKIVTPVYQARGNVLVIAGLGQSATGSNSVDLSVSAAEATTTAATLMTTPPLLQSVIDANHLDETEPTLANNVTATPQPNSELVDVSVTDPSADRAALVANGIMNAFADQITKQNTDRINAAGTSMQTQINQVQASLAQYQQQLASAAAAKQDTTALQQAISGQQALLTQLNLNYSNFRASQQANLETVSVATPASAPATPSSPKTVLNVALGAAAGLIVGLALAAVLEYLDQGLKTPEDVERRLGIPCLGVVPWYREPGRRGKQARDFQSATDAYRRVRTNLLFASPDAELRSVVITSARAGEGKTQTATRLALALAGLDKRVVLVDADMRRPDLHRIFGRPLRGGMSEMIMGVQNGFAPELNGAHATDEPNLALITSGVVPANPTELLASKKALFLLRSLEAGSDLVVLDTPPVEAVPDALSLAAEASGTVMVIEAGKTNATQAAETIAQLHKVGASVLGVVLNKARERRNTDYYYEYEAEERADSAPQSRPAAAPPPPARAPRAAR